MRREQGLAIAESRVAGRGGIEVDRVGGREGNYYTPHSVKNLTKLASWAVEIEEDIGSSWRKDLPSLLVEDFFFFQKNIHCQEKLTKISRQIWRN